MTIQYPHLVRDYRPPEPCTCLPPPPASGSKQIRKVAVLGAGTMGSRIAAHIANAGLPVVLLDIVPPGTAADAPKPERNKFVLAALDGLKKSKPAAFYTPDSARLLTLGNFDDDLALIADCDWIIEAVAENLDIKHALLAKVAQHRRPGAILTTNTSGLPIASVAAGLSGEAKQHFFGTHFFNPPRYMRLLEIIPTPDTDPADIAPSRTSATSASARPSSTRTTPPTSSPTASAPSP